MVHVPRDQVLPDALAGLPEEERDVIAASEGRLVKHLARLTDRGAWPPPRADGVPG
jgi:hypothetical protein